MWEQMLNGNERGKFCALAFTKLLAFYETMNIDMGLPDPLTVATLIWPECVEEAHQCSAVVCTNEYEPTYGQVIFYRMDKIYEAQPELENGYNVQLITKINPDVFMKNFLDVMTK